MLVVGLAALSLCSSAARADSGGLVAAYGFEETAGTSSADSSGSGNTGTVAGPVSSALGRFGRGLSFDGVNDLVNVADSNSLDLTSGMTVEAWVKPEGTGWQTVLLKERPGGLAYALYSSTDTGTPSAEVRTSASTETRGSSSLPFATWSHLATTYDGATLRLYVNGSQVSSRAVTGSVAVGTGALRIGGNLVWGEYFRGLIDEVRVYQRALGATEIQADMGTAIVSSADTQSPSSPGGLAATVTQDDVHLTWSASSDNVGVSGYRLYRSPSAGFTPDAGTLIATLGAAALAYDDLNRAPGTSYYKVVAFDAAGNSSASSAAAAATVTGDFQAPSTPGAFGATVFDDDVQLTWTASNDNVAVAGYRVYRSSNPGYTPGPGYLLATLGSASTSYVDVDLQPGPWYYRLLAFDAAGNASVPTAEVAAVVVTNDIQPPTPPTSLSASVSGDEVSLTWVASTDNRGVYQYRVYRGTTPAFPTSGDFAVVDGGVTAYLDDVNQPSGTYYYKVLALDLAGNQSAASNEVSATLGPDVTPPTVSIDAACDGATPVKEYFDVYVNLADDRGSLTVQMLVDGEFVRQFSSAPGRARVEWSTRNRHANGLHVMTMVARDGAGNETTSAPCQWNVQNPVLTVPIISPAAGDVVSGVVSVTAEPRADGQPVTGFPLRGVLLTVDGVSIGNVWSPPFQASWDTTQVANGVHTVKAWLYWLDYFSEQATSTIQVTVNNLVPQPTAPGNLTATVLSGDDVRLNWGPSTGGTGGVTSYRVYRDDNLIATRGAASPREHDDVNVTVGTHTYKVVAVDSVGTAGPPSTETAITIEPDTTAPTVTLGGPSCAGTVAGYVPLRPTVSDDRGPVTLRVELDGATVFGPFTALATGPYTNLSASVNFFWEIGATPPGLHVMTAYARDAAGHETASDPCLWTVAVLSVPFTSPAAGSTVSGTVPVEALALLGDQPAQTTGNVTMVVFTVDGVGGDALVDRNAPYQFSWDTTTVPNGTHTLKAELWWMDYGTPRATSTIQVTVNNLGPPPPTGLVAAYGFDEASGLSVTDSSGAGNTGTISGATRSASGKYGGALSFDGLNDLVSIADSNSLDLTTGMTLEAWVRPTAINDWRTVLFKERPGGLAYGLYGSTDTGRPGGFVDIGGERSARSTTALPLNTWTHLAATYGGGNLRLYVNGVQAGTLAQTGGIPVTAGQLKIGGNSIWSEWFKGLIDEVRVYNRALTAAEIQADRDRPVN